MRYTRKMPYRIRVAAALLGLLLLLTAVPSLANNNLADSMNPRSTERVSATVADLTSSPDEQKSVAITIYNARSFFCCHPERKRGTSQKVMDYSR